MKRKIKKDKAIFRLVLVRGAYAVVNTDNVLLYMCNSINELAEVCATISNMPWQFDSHDLYYFDRRVEIDFWNTYDNTCLRLKEEFVKLHHTNLV